MAIYTVRNKKTGQTLKIRGDRPPTPEYLNSLGTQPEPKESFLQKAGGFAKDLALQATGAPRLAFQALKSSASAPALALGEKRLESIRQQPLTPERVAQEEQMANKLKAITSTPLLTQNELERSSQGVGEGAKLGFQRGAGTAAFMVPGGAGASLGSKVGLGATAGALTGASQGDDISPGNIAFGAGTGAAVPLAIAGVGKGADLFRKGARNLSERFVTQGLGSPSSLKRASGLNPNDSLFHLFEKYDLWDRMPQSAKAALSEVDDLYQKAISGSDDTIPLGQVVRKFDDAISELQGISDESGAVQKQIAELAKRRDMLIGKMDDFSVGSLDIYGSKKAASKDLLNTAFSQTSRQKGRGLGTKQAYNIFRGSLDDVAPSTATLGREEAALMELAKVFDKYQGRGMGREMLNFTKLGSMGVGGLLGGLPGAIGGFIMESAARSPSGTRILSKTFNELSKAEIQWLISAMQKASPGVIIGGTNLINDFREGEARDNPFSEAESTPSNTNKKNPYRNKKVNVEYKF